MPEIAHTIHELSVAPVGSSPDEAAAFLKLETDRWRELLGVKLRPGRDRSARSSSRKSHLPHLSVNPTQTFFYLLSNRVSIPIRYGSRVRQDCTR
jgi:hypothetical protein